MGIIDISQDLAGHYYGIDPNRLKEYSDRFIYVLMGMDNRSNTPNDIVAVDDYKDVLYAAEKESVFNGCDYAVLLWVKPVDPRDIPDIKEPEMFVWVTSDVIYPNSYKRCETVEEATEFIEGLVNMNVAYAFDIDDFIVLIGKEIDWPAENKPLEELVNFG